MSILGKIFGEGLEGAGKNIVKKGAKEASESTLSKIGKKIPVSYTDDVAQDIAVKAPEMVQVYRGMAAKTDDELKQYLSDMIDYNIKPRTYSGLNVSGEGYNFTTNPIAATKYANTNPVKESRVVLTTELPKNRFIQQNAANQNRLQDFISRAESRGIPYEGGASERAARKDMEAYFKKNGLLGVRNNSGQIFVVNQNDPEWIDKLAVDKAMRGRRSGIVEDMALKNDLGSILKNVDVQNDLDNASKFLQPKEPLTLYHGSPIKGIKDLDINMAGKNTMSGEKAIYFTDDYPTAETFSYERNPSNSMFVDNKGKKGEVYTRNVNTDNFLDLDNLTDEQIADLYNYIDPRSAGLMDENKFIQTLNDARAAGNSQMIKAQLDLNKLANDYDGFMAKMYPGESDVREYGVFNPQNIITPDVEQYLPKKLDVSGDDVAQDIPVYTKDDFITDPSIFDDPAFADIVKNNNIENVMKKATKSDLELVKRAKAGEVLTKDEIRNSRFAKNLGIDAKRAQLKYGNKLNITKAMEEGKEKVQPELEKRLRGMADQVLDRLHKDPNIKYDHKAVIFMGGPSSGKSSAGMKLYDAAKGGDYAVIDSDDIKPMFEEFGKGEGAGAVHLASAYTAKNMVLPDAAAEGMNLALPIVGKSDDALNYHLNLLKNAGYDVSVVDVSLPTDKAASRNFGRMMETNRNVEDTYVRDKVGQKPAEVYKRMVENVKSGKDKRVSGYAKISNDVKFGEPQILEEISPSDVLKRVQDKFGKKNDEKINALIKKAKNYKTAERFEKMNNPIKGSEIWTDEKGVRVDMFPNDAVKGSGITKQYLLNLFKDAYDQGITRIIPSYGIYTKEGQSFMDHLADQGWVSKVGNQYEVAPKIAEWKKTSPLRDIYEKAHN